MKHSLLISLIAITVGATAQPVIQNGNVVPEPGFTSPLSIGMAL